MDPASLLMEQVCYASDHGYLERCKDEFLIKSILCTAQAIENLNLTKIESHLAKIANLTGRVP